MIPENTKTNFFKFEGLRIYHKSVDFTNAILSLSNTVQTNAQKIIVDQFLNEAGHISANIIEGAGRSKTEFIEYLQEVDGNQPLFLLAVYMVYSVILDTAWEWCITRNDSSYKGSTMKSSDM